MNQAAKYLRRAKSATIQGLAKAPLQLNLQVRLGITEQLAAAGGSMTRRQLFHIRRARVKKGWWHIAMLQLEENGFVEMTGAGKRGDPIVVRLVKPLPEGPETD